MAAALRVAPGPSERPPTWATGWPRAKLHSEMVSTAEEAWMAATLRGALGLASFRGSEGETFTALGDDEGLLMACAPARSAIVVQRGREWSSQHRPGRRARALLRMSAAHA